MVDLEKLKIQKKKDLQESLAFIDACAEWIKENPNEVWSKQQADLFKSVIDSINENWRRSLAKSKS
jgi:hypothetical protein